MFYDAIALCYRWFDILVHCTTTILEDEKKNGKINFMTVIYCLSADYMIMCFFNKCFIFVVYGVFICIYVLLYKCDNINNNCWQGRKWSFFLWCVGKKAEVKNKISY